MTKRPLDSASPSPTPERLIPAQAERQAARRNDRSHEENQERAYIAASRRADRSIEARVQSAKMASEIHKKRTGKGFKITEEIVMREEMYEEEEDDLPRQYRAFAAHLHTASPDMNSRVNAFVTNQVALASLARHQEVDRMFAEHFPMVAQQAAQLQHMPGHTSQHLGHPLHSYQLPSHHQYPPERTHSMPDAMSPSSPYQPINQPCRPSSTRHTSIDEQISFAASASGSSASRVTPITNYSDEDMTTIKQNSVVPVDPSLTISTLSDEPPPSPFTSDLPMESKMLLGGDINHQIMSAMYAGELMGSEDYFSSPQDTLAYSVHIPYGHSTTTQEHLLTSFDLPQSQSQSTGPQMGHPAEASGSGTPNVHVDFDQWLTDPNLNR